MKLALLTQRVDPHPSYDERRDGLDQRWADVLNAAGFAVCAMPNFPQLDVQALLDRLAPELIVLTGGNSLALGDCRGPEYAPERDALERKMITAAMERGIPLKGVCRGMQMLNVHCGGALREIPGHVAVRHSLRGEGPDEVNSFHGFGIASEDLADGLEATAWAPDGSVEAFRMRGKRVAAIMWHPEREERYHEKDLAWLADDR